MKKEYITREGYQKLCEKYIEIDQEIANVLKQMGESAKRDNDLRENSEYMDLRVKAMHELPKQKTEIFHRKNNVIIIEETDEYKNFDGNTVIKGSEVDLIIDGEEETYKILGDKEGKPEEGIISCNTELAKAVLNKHIGDLSECNGMKITIKAVRII